MEKNTVYKMLINNANRYLEQVDPLDFNSLNAFEISTVLSICLDKSKEEIIMDIVGGLK